MSSTPLVFSSIKTHADNKKLEKDSNGYYKVILGAINSFNSSGAFYVADGVKELIENESQLLTRRLKKGYLAGEMGHPGFLPGMSTQDFIIRNMRIEMSNISHYIKEIILTPTNEDSGIPGRGKVILIEGWVKPGGPHGDMLKAALDNPDQNVAFSIRALSSDRMVGGVMTKKLEQIITWDWVLEPGIAKANTWDKLSMESLDICKFDSEDLLQIINSKSMDNLTHEAPDVKEALVETYSKVKSVGKPNDVFYRW